MSDITVFDPATLAEALAAASQPVAAETLPVPGSISEALAVQAVLSARLPASPAGYKVALSPEGVAVTGRLHPYAENVGRFPASSAARIEVEVAVRIGKALPPRAEGYSREDVVDAIAGVYLGIEILDSRIIEGGKGPYLLFLADRLGNAGYLLGPELPRDLVDGVGKLQLVIDHAGRNIHTAAAAHPAGDVLAWLLAFANHAGRPEGSLAAGEVITTGSLCGAIPVSSPGTLTAVLGDEYRVSLELTA